jgi:hypothetical protein
VSLEGAAAKPWSGTTSISVGPDAVGKVYLLESPARHVPAASWGASLTVLSAETSAEHVSHTGCMYSM